MKNLVRTIVIPAKAGIHDFQRANGFQIEFGMTKLDRLRFFPFDFAQGYPLRRGEDAAGRLRSE
jgi:hypothetical protein